MFLGFCALQKELQLEIGEKGSDHKTMLGFCDKIIQMSVKTGKIVFCFFLFINLFILYFIDYNFWGLVNRKSYSSPSFYFVLFLLYYYGMFFFINPFC